MAESGAPMAQPDPFSRPIPGQGLTDPPGAMPWQKPPMFVHLDEALDFVWERLSQPKNVAQVLALLSTKKLSAQDVADCIIMQGFTGGQWTVTLGLMMAKPVWQMVAVIGHKAGIKFNTKTKKPDPVVTMMTELKMAETSGAPDMLGQGEAAPPPAAPEMGQPPAAGFMSKPEGMV